MSNEQNPARALRVAARGFFVLAAASYALIVLGALVRANAAGLACPDWPLCFGKLVPVFDMKVGFEWSHRLLAGLVSLGLLALSFAVLRSTPETRVRRGLAVAWVLLAVQVVPGGLTVLLLLAPWTVTAHLVTGTLFFIALIWVGIDLRESHTAASARPAPPLGNGVRALIGLTSVAVVGQIVLGGIVSSHSAGLACHTFPTCDGSSFVPTLSGLTGIHVLHRLNAVVLLAGFGALAVAGRGHPSIAPLARFAVHLVFLQAIVGILNVLLRIPVEVTALHSALAAAIALCTGLLVRQAVWLPRLPSESGARELRSNRVREAA